MAQLEAKLETSRHNMKIQMDKELVVLQKQINLHVNDIERMQGFVSTIANKKGKTRDELLRTKERSRKTMDQLRRGREIQSAKPNGNEAGATRKASSTMMVGAGATMTSSAFAEGSPVDVLLFGDKKKKDMFATSSFGMTSSSDGRQ